ncbi:serine O-acetyltransferase EpsC [Cohnella sp. REN36]|uniref:serine O-acetyltransferase EpsC n=1 Tax=Cohnella sp. REN36 TaxID=2887347 RepID=UPI002714FAEB|nr:serine O-acetyltransferase EpsC [Cohnella sp. REN36]
MFRYLTKDIERLIQKRVTFFRALKLLLLDVSVQCVALLRIQTFFTRHNLYFLAKITRNLNQYLTGAEFGIGVQIGAGLIIRHPNGIVVGHGAVIGDNCTLLHQVTLGEKYGDQQPSTGKTKYPIVGNHVTIGAGAKILGAVHIGDYAKIGANAVVIQDVNSHSVAVGVPAKVIPNKKKEYELQVLS